MGKLAVDKALVELIVRILVRFVLVALAAVGFEDVVGEEAIKTLLDSFFTHLVTAILVGLSLYDLFRKPENRAKFSPYIEKVKNIFLEKPQQ